MRTLCWLASYPKSGNTWVRVLLQNYLSPCEPTSINALSIRAAANWHLWDVYGVCDPSDLPAEMVTNLRPDLHRAMARSVRPPCFLKVHDCATSTDEGQPLFEPAVTLAAIYVVRHPCDVAVSLSHHLGCSVADAVAFMLNPSARLLGRASSQCSQYLSSWAGHVRSWQQAPLSPVVIHYEDLLREPDVQFTRVLEAVGLPAEQSRVRHAVEHSRFDRLQGEEAAVGFAERAAHASAPFFRSGRAGGWRDHPERDVLMPLLDSDADLLQSLGYLQPGSQVGTRGQ